MALKLILCCGQVIFIHGIVEEKLRNFYRVVFFEICKFFKITPMVFNIKKIPCIGKPGTV